MAEGKTLCVCIPAFNAARTIESELKQLIPLKKAGVIDSILVVNDGSTDKTQEILEKYSKEIEIIRFPKNHGKSAAVAEGMRWARQKKAKIFGMLDADLLEVKGKQINAMKKALGKPEVKMVVGNSLLEFRGEPWNATVNSGQRLIRMDALRPFFAGNPRWTRLIAGEIRQRKKGKLITEKERAGYGLELALNELFEGATAHVETNFKSTAASIAGDGSFIAMRGKELGRITKLKAERNQKLRDRRKELERRREQQRKRKERLEKRAQRRRKPRH